MNNMIGIGEFARQAGLTVSAVRFYADRDLLVPAEVDASTGYRLFRPEQLTNARLIRDMRRIEMSLATITEAIALSPAEMLVVARAHLARRGEDLDRAKRLLQHLGTDLPAVLAATPEVTTLRAADFVAALERLLPFVANVDLPHLATVRIEVVGGVVRLVATDTHRLSVCEIATLPTSDSRHPAEPRFAVLVAAATMRDWLTGLDPGKNMQLSFDGAILATRTGAVELNAPAIPAQFPDYEPFLEPVNVATTVLVTKADLLEVLEQCDPTATAVLTPMQDSIQIESKGRSFTVEASSVSSGRSIALDVAFAIICVQGAEGDEIALEFEDDPKRPVAFRSAATGSSVSLLMPVLV